MDEYDNKFLHPERDVRMFVIVRSDIPYEHQAVQGGHAVAEYLMDADRTYKFDPDTPSHRSTWNELYAKEKEPSNHTWTNGTMIYLSVSGELELLQWQRHLDRLGIKSKMFEEPDWGSSPVPTALATIGVRGDFYKLPLLKMPKGFFANAYRALFGFPKLNLKRI